MSPVLEIYKELNALDSITYKLDCLSGYHMQVYGKYKAQNNTTTEGLISIYKLVDKFKQKHFPNTNDPEFTFWFLKYNAQHYFSTYILTANLVRRLNSTVGKDEATIELKKIEKAQKLARTLVIENDIDTDSKYKDQKGYLYLMNPKNLPQPEYQTKEIRRVLNGYYKSNPTEHSYTVIQSPEVKAYAKHVIYKGYLNKILKPNQESVEFSIDSKLSLPQIALIHAYNDHLINRENGDEIAVRYGHNSGERLYQLFNKYYKSTARRGDEGTDRKNQNKINLIESILDYLPIGSKEKALSEISILKNFAQ